MSRCLVIYVYIYIYIYYIYIYIYVCIYIYVYSQKACVIYITFVVQKYLILSLKNSFFRNKVYLLTL